MLTVVSGDGDLELQRRKGIFSLLFLSFPLMEELAQRGGV